MTDLREILPDAASRRLLRRRLMAWYDIHARNLPWRGTHDPYAVWLSEIMLQQTQVGAVIGYFERFMKALPTVESLAKADEHEVLRLWEGLGYYRRARQLHQAAKIIATEHGGRFPSDPEIVRRLPGIGRYTAGAILSIAFDAQEPILEANTLRLFARLLAYPDDPRATEGQRILWAMAEAVLPRHDCGRFNQALMDLGSTVCTVRSPQCEACPLAMLCRANQQGRQLEIPLPKGKRTFESVREAAVVVRRNGRVLLLRWPEGRRWAGLWDFPRFSVSAGPGPVDPRELVENVQALTGATVLPGSRITTFTHGVTRFRITLECFEAEFVSQKKTRTQLETRWASPSQFEEFPLNSTGRKLAKILQKQTMQKPRKVGRKTEN